MKKSKTKKRKLWLILIPVVLLLVGGGLVFFWHSKKAKGGDDRREMSFGSGRNSGFSYSGLNMQGMTTGSGVTNMGTVAETFDVTELETQLMIEEVYVASGDELKAGDRVLKLTQESVESARKELEKKEQEAELAYRTGAIEYERSKIVAEYTRDSAVLSGSQADSVYQDSMADSDSELEKAKEKLSEAQEQINEYGSYVDDGSYRAYFKVDEYQKLYDENLKILTDNMDKWGISWAEVTSQGRTDYSTEHSQWVSILRSLYSVLEQNRKDLDNALSEYESALSTASLEKKVLELSVSELQESVSEAKAQYEKTVLQNQLTKEKSKVNADSAQRDYETTLEKAESDFADLKSAWEDAKANLEVFEAQVGDGYFYASSDGNVLRTSVRAGSSLKADSTVFIYSDPAAMTVTVSVNQTDIAKITPGESVVVMSQSGTMMDGSVKSVNPVSTSESRNNVTYSVIVELSGAGALGSNESVSVIFGMSTAELSTSGDGGNTKQSGDGSEDSSRERPSGMPGDWSGEMPSDWSGERPSGMPGDWSGEMPSDWSEERPSGMPGDWSGEMPSDWSGERPSGMPGGRSGEKSSNGKGEE